MTIDEEYRATRRKSAELYARAVKVIPSGLDTDAHYIEPFPFYTERAQGARKWDVDGNEMIDLWSGHGALVLGHNPPSVVQAVAEQIEKGFHYSSCHRCQVEMAELIVQLLPSAEKVRFMQSGTEANMLAIRIARAYTGRNKVIKFRGHFHGYWDEGSVAIRPPYDTPMSVGIPKEAVSNVLVADHNSSEDVRRLVEESNDDIACVIVDPTGRSFDHPIRPGFLEEVREITKKKGIVLIFDEVISGFRYGPHGIQGIIGVTPELTTLAKTVGGGLPLSMVAGKKEVMDVITLTDDAEHNRFHRVISQGTHSGQPVCCAAGLAYLKLLATGEPQAYINKLGAMLRKRMNEVIKKHRINGCTYGNYSIARPFLLSDCPYIDGCDYVNCRYPDAARQDAGSPPEVRNKLHLAMVLNGVDYGRGTGHMFLNAALTEHDIEKIVDAFDRSLTRLKREGTLKAHNEQDEI